VYLVDELDALVKLTNVPRPDYGAPCPIVIADEGRLVLSYWEIDQPPYKATTAALALVSFVNPYMHMFGPPDEDGISGHPLANRGLYPCSAFRVEHSSLVRRLLETNSVHEVPAPKASEPLQHYIFTFHDSTFECVAGAMESQVECVGLDEEHARTLQLLKSRVL